MNALSDEPNLEFSQGISPIRRRDDASEKIAAELSEASGALVGLTEKMSANAEKNASQAGTASALAEEVSQNVVSIAGAVEEMSATIREISSAVSDSSNVAADVVCRQPRSLLPNRP